MPNTIVVGDSVGLGISQAIPGSQFVGAEGRQLSQMGPDFNSAIAAAGQGDTIIISAGYNGAFSTQDVSLLTNSIQQMRQKGARVVIAGLRETGMDEAINTQYAATNRQLQQVASATGAVFSNQCTTIGNSLPAGNVHGGYPQLAQACMSAAAGGSPAAATGASTTTPGAGSSAEADRDAESRNNEGGMRGFFLMLSRIPGIGGIFRWLGNLFGMNIPEEPAAAPTAPTTGGAGASTTEPQTTPDERTRAAARDAASGNAAAGTGASVTSASVPVSLPPGNGQQVRGA